MGERIPPNPISSGTYFQCSLPPSPIRPPQDRERYLADLLSERHSLKPFMKALPMCTKLLNQEIIRISAFHQPAFMDHDRFDPDTPYSPFPFPHHSNTTPMDFDGLPPTFPPPPPPPPPPQQQQDKGNFQRMAPFQAPPMGWPGTQAVSTTPVVKRVIRLDVPVDKYPNYNFVGRILGPRGNSLKRVEAMTECRVYIRGCGSVKDSIKEEKLKDKPGYEHLKEPLHVLVEAEFPEDIINARLDHAVAILENLLKPVDESLDHYKKQQLRELAILNGTLREESPSMSPSMSPGMSPFNNTGMKRAKTGR